METLRTRWNLIENDETINSKKETHKICQNLNVTHKDEHFEKKNALDLNETRGT